jgi:chromosome condensin MukBEF ATPase and DNA-binding subunit MukB
LPTPFRPARTEVARLRRTNLRLRALIDEMKTQLAENRHDLDIQFRRIAQLQEQVDALRKASGR